MKDVGGDLARTKLDPCEGVLVRKEWKLGNGITSVGKKKMSER